jgi:hypothetical protein
VFFPFTIYVEYTYIFEINCNFIHLHFCFARVVVAVFCRFQQISFPSVFVYMCDQNVGDC